MGIYEAIKDAVNIAMKADNFELISKLMDAQKESLDLLEENRQLRLRINELEDNDNLAKSLFFINNCYYRLEDKNFNEPFCTNCWDNNRKLIRMHKYEDSIGHWVICNICKVDLRDKKE